MASNYLKEEPDNQEDYSYSEYPDTSDEETELVDLESQTGDELSSLREDVAAWAVETKQTHSSVNKMLAILRKHGHNLPKDGRTLLQTPCFVDSKKKFQRAVVEILLEIRDEVKSLNQQGDIEDGGEQIRQLPLRTLEEAQRMSLEIDRHPNIKRSLEGH
ncbi:uncharacterized protein LOC127943657 [Xyrichtys novacula]|uniref:Uncharacterized protein LOC127943657 n=1 Tax=Xyrichtys novacula TaxID=13765 RepID=A0AAV1GH18_XYRNO|nr:uncharacterized protein LOC127943657 [Xyrichtys novacula]